MTPKKLFCSDTMRGWRLTPSANTLVVALHDGNEYDFRWLSLPNGTKLHRTTAGSWLGYVYAPTFVVNDDGGVFLSAGRKLGMEPDRQAARLGPRAEIVFANASGASDYHSHERKCLYATWLDQETVIASCIRKLERFHAPSLM